MPCKLLFVALLALSVGCGPRFKPRYDSAWNCFSHPESAQIIVVARVEPNAVSPVAGDAIPVGKAQLLKVRVSVENVLKGDVPAGDASVFYFQAAAPHGPGPIAFFFRQTSRVMLVLLREQGKLRMAEDITSDCEAGVYSGAHLNFRARPGEPLREEMIDLLLTPGAGATDIGMLQAIFGRALFEISPEYAARGLLRLAASERPVVRTAACLEFRDIMAELLGKNPSRELL